jgi:uncharacterized protein (DUF1697 family)
MAGFAGLDKPEEKRYEIRRRQQRRSLMAVFVALLRGINMGGHNRLAMADLRALAEEIGFAAPRTLLNSGNLIFASRNRLIPALEATIEREIENRFGLNGSVMVRTLMEWRGIVADNPFRVEAKAGKLAVIFLKSKPSRAAARALEAAVTGSEYFEIRDRELYAVYPDGFGKSKFTLPAICRVLNTDGTARGWSTVLRIAALLEPPEPPLPPKPLPKALRLRAAYAKCKMPR